MKNYRLDTISEERAKGSTLGILRAMAPFFRSERKTLIVSFFAILINSLLTLVGPYLIGRSVDRYVIPRDFHGLLVSGLAVLGVYVLALAMNYAQFMLMGGVGQRTMYRLRNQIFTKLGSLPVAFFNDNKAGDLISRINNDTDKLNQFFAQTLTRFIGTLFTVLGAAVFVMVLNWKLGLITIAPAIVVILATQATGPWVKKKNAKNLQAVGSLSAEIKEALENFKVVVAFDRRDYFRSKFSDANDANYRAAVRAGLTNNIFQPSYDLASNVAMLFVVIYSIALISRGSFTVGLLVSFIVLVDRFYNPLRALASVWSSFQLALAAWDRAADLLGLESDLKIEKNGSQAHSSDTQMALAFNNVSFGYVPGKPVLADVSISLQEGKTYALVGPTGGGKSTTASLMARLYDPQSGSVSLYGTDIKHLNDRDRTAAIGFILQEPFLLGSNLKQAIMYGTENENASDAEAMKILSSLGLGGLLDRFPRGLETPVSNEGSVMSLGERQVVAFMRAVVRRPKILILDEATANIDTVTEELLEHILAKLPKTTTKVIIAHRLNTIKSADEIFFINGGSVIPAGSFDHAVSMLIGEKRSS